jgi:GGDEF domain-containing protein
MQADLPQGREPQDDTFIVVQRKVRSLDISTQTVEAVRRLLAPIYKHIGTWRPAFDYGMRDWLYQATDFTNSANSPDDVLNSLMDMVVHLGGETASQRDRWHFACLLLPDDPALPLQQHSLVVQAQSTRAPYKVGISTANPEHAGLSLRAYQSGYVIYPPTPSSIDLMLAYPEQEGHPRSAIAFPIAGEDGGSIAVLYIASDEDNAFSGDDQRVLRLLGKMIQELLLTYSARQLATGKLTELVGAPGIVDISFKEFLSESDFIRDLETLVEAIDRQDDPDFIPEEEVSFIAIDIDNQSALATKYGDRVARNLSREVGSRILKQLRLFEKLANRGLYHLNADRYYLFLDGMKLEEARDNAYKLKIDLTGDYQIDARPISSVRRPTLPGAKLELSGVTVRLGVTSYKYKKLKEVLQRPADDPLARLEALIMGSLDTVLSLGQAKGGDVIISWDRDLWSYTSWSPPR